LDADGGSILKPIDILGQLRGSGHGPDQIVLSDSASSFCHGLVPLLCGEFAETCFRGDDKSCGREKAKTGGSSRQFQARIRALREGFSPNGGNGIQMAGFHSMRHLTGLMALNGTFGYPWVCIPGE
jgi:hypothetical protein